MPNIKTETAGAGAGTDDEGLLAADKALEIGGQKLKEAAAAYAVGGTVVAVTGLGGEYSIYGRHDARGFTSLFGGTNRLPTPPGLSEDTNKLVTKPLSSGEPISRVFALGSQVELDARQFIEPSVNGAQMNDPAVSWEATCRGRVEFLGSVEGLRIIPDKVSFRKDGNSFEEFTLTESVDSLGGVNSELVLEGSWNDSKFSLNISSLNASVALLMDEKVNGGWEQPESLWLIAGDGFVRVDSDVRLGTLPYGLEGETRVVDATSGLADADVTPVLPEGSRLRLMLDRSGEKTLVLRQTQAGTWDEFAVTLSVKAPSFSVLIPHVAIDGATLSNPKHPPSDSDGRRARTLQIVASPLLNRSPDLWAFEYGHQNAQAVLNPRSGRQVCFMPFESNVLPPECAQNSRGFISAARLLFGRETKAVELTLGRSGISVSDPGNEPSSELDPDLPIGTFPWEKDAAKMRGALLTEYNRSAKKLAPRQESGDAVVLLRPWYTEIPDGTGTTGPVSYALTRTGKPLTQTRTISVRDLPGRGFAWRQMAGEQEPQRWYLPNRDSVAGWEFHRLVQAGGSTYPVGLIEATKDDKKWKVASWVRLPNDSLTRLEGGGVADDLEEPQKIYTTTGFWRRGHAVVVDAAYGGLSCLWLEEDLAAMEPASRFTLYLIPDRNNPKDRLELPVSVKSSPNRVVMTLQKPFKKDIRVSLPDGVEAIRLNILYLEAERSQHGFEVRRATVGWQAGGAFGWKVPGWGKLHVTELYDRRPDNLAREVEFNGVLARSNVKKKGEKPDGRRFDVEVYFWDTVRRPSFRSVRVICRYLFRPEVAGAEGMEEASTEICSVQDALIGEGGSGLDLSADLLLFTGETASATPDSGAGWRPDRRGLYQVLIAQEQADAGAVSGILRIRGAVDGADLLNFEGRTSRVTQLKVLPSWDKAQARIIPWFTAETRDDRPTGEEHWLGRNSGDEPETLLSPKLRTRSDWSGSQLRMSLYLRENLKAGQRYGTAVLVDPIGTPPEWIPSPVIQVVQTAGAVDTDEVRFRVWVFDPYPRQIAEWPADDALPAGGVDPRPYAIKRAGYVLIRTGWCREAVLEGPAAGEWTVIDSPLANRDSGRGWFGWPAQPGDSHPALALPSSILVHTADPGTPESFAVQVPFLCDGDWRATVINDGATDPRKSGQSMLFRPGRLRPGSYYEVQLYDPRKRQITLSPQKRPWPVPDPVSGGAPIVLSTDGRSVHLLKRSSGVWLFAYDQEALVGREGGFALRNADGVTGVTVARGVYSDWRIEHKDGGWNLWPEASLQRGSVTEFEVRTADRSLTYTVSCLDLWDDVILRWRDEPCSVPRDRVDVLAADGGYILLKFSLTPLDQQTLERVKKLTVAGAPTGSYLLGSKSADAADGIPAGPAETMLEGPTGTVSMRVPKGAGIGSIRISRKIEGAADSPERWESDCYFLPETRRLAGIYDADRVLTAFGEETVLFYPPDPPVPVADPAVTSFAWRRTSSYALPAGRLLRRKHRPQDYGVQTLDMNGKVIRHSAE